MSASEHSNLLSDKVLNTLENLRELPSIPAVAAAVLSAIEDPDLSASSISRLIERDPALTARTLAVANSPFYGFVRRISTVELAVVMLGVSTMKEIVLSVILQRIFTRIRPALLDVRTFWRYSVYCGTTARTLARKLGYRVAGEAFVAGLIHDIGVLIEAQFFPKEFEQVRELQATASCSFIEAELEVFNAAHTHLGAWFASKWQLPHQLINAIYWHHTPSPPETAFAPIASTKDSETAQPLTAMVALSEFFAADMGFKSWAAEDVESPLYLPDDLLELLRSNPLMDSEDSIEALRNNLREEYELAVQFFG